MLTSPVYGRINSVVKFLMTLIIEYICWKICDEDIDLKKYLIGRAYISDNKTRN